MSFRNAITTALLCLSFLIFIQGCGQGVNFAQDALNKNTNNSTPPPTDVSACIIDVPQIHLQGNVDAFDFKSSGGFTFGFSKGGSYQGGGSLSFTLSTAELIMSIVAMDPFNAGQWAAYSMTTTDQHTVDISGRVDFSGAYVNGHWTLPEPLERVTSAGLTLGITELNTSYDKATSGLSNSGPQNWMGRVIDITGTNDVIINASTSAGIEDGDIFYVYNVKHIWQNQNAPCASNHLAEVRAPTIPVATIIAHPNTSTTSMGEIIQTDGINKIALGAQIIIKQLKNDNGKNRFLKKKVVFDGITSKNFQVEGKDGKYVEFPFQDVINDQTRNLLLNPGNYFWTP